MSWMNTQVSLYSTHADNTGRPATIRQVLLNDCIHDLPTLIKLSKLDRQAPDYKQQKQALKATLQCYTPAALLASKARGQVSEILRTGIMQLDFDHEGISEYDVEELKACVFSLPFIGFCGLSCSGDGFYALALIAEPERLSAYAEHCFDVLLSYGIKADTSKGKKVENLRYVSYDSRMLIRENPVPLKINRFKPVPQPKPVYASTSGQEITPKHPLVKKQLELILTATVGCRWQTVQKAAYTLGGLGDPGLLDDITACIQRNLAFAGQEAKYTTCALKCFADGALQPLSHPAPVTKKISKHLLTVDGSKGGTIKREHSPQNSFNLFITLFFIDCCILQVCTFAVIIRSL